MNVMSEKTSKLLVIFSAIFLLLCGLGLYKLFDYQGMGDSNTNKNVVNYDVKDYVDTVAVVFSDYSDVYDKINVSKVNLKNLSSESISDFILEEKELISYIGGYYDELLSNGTDYANTVNSTIKMQINNAILSIYYELDFDLDSDIFNNDKMHYVITTNIDLLTEKVLSNDDFLNKYNYTKRYIAEKIFEEDLLISSGQIVIDKNTNISLTREDIERKKSEYVDRIIMEFDNIIKVYIENKSLSLVYNKRDLRSLFFDNDFDSEIIVRYLKQRKEWCYLKDIFDIRVIPLVKRVFDDSGSRVIENLSRDEIRNMSCEPKMLHRNSEGVFFSFLPPTYHDTCIKWSLFYLYDDLNDYEKELYFDRTEVISTTRDGVLDMSKKRVMKK